MNTRHRDEPIKRSDLEDLAAGSLPVSDGAWRKSTFSGANGDCVEVAEAGELVAVRHSREPEQGTLVYTRTEIDAFIRGCKAGEFDYLIEL